MSNNFMISLIDGETLIAQAWQLSTEPAPPYRVWIDGSGYLTVDTEADVETLFELVARLHAKERQDAHERDDPETGEPVPSYVEGRTVGAGPARVAV